MQRAVRSPLGLFFSRLTLLTLPWTHLMKQPQCWALGNTAGVCPQLHVTLFPTTLWAQPHSQIFTQQGAYHEESVSSGERLVPLLKAWLNSRELTLSLSLICWVGHLLLGGAGLTLSASLPSSSFVTVTFPPSSKGWRFSWALLLLIM